MKIKKDDFKRKVQKKNTIFLASCHIFFNFAKADKGERQKFNGLVNVSVLYFK